MSDPLITLEVGPTNRITIHPSDLTDEVILKRLAEDGIPLQEIPEDLLPVLCTSIRKLKFNVYAVYTDTRHGNSTSDR